MSLENITDASAFNFNTMAQEVGIDPFAATSKKYAKDDRFYTLKKDKDGNGAALIRFLPDAEKGTIQRMYTIGTTVVKNDKKRFMNEFSPRTIGYPCPFNEAWQEAWNKGDKEGAKVFGTGTRYITNIKVLKDPLAPENEGKIFLYNMSNTMKDKLQQALQPSEQDRALGAEPKELFNPLAGNSFRLVAKKGSNNMISYDSSEVMSEVTSIYPDVQSAVTDIKENVYLLSDLIKPEAFMSYEELTKKLKWVTFDDAETPAVAPVATVAPVEPVQAPAQPAQTVQTENVQVQPTPVQSAPAQEVVAAAQPEVATVVQPAQPAQSLDSMLDALM